MAKYDSQLGACHGCELSELQKHAPSELDMNAMLQVTCCDNSLQCNTKSVFVDNKRVHRYTEPGESDCNPRR
jgi:hypothetical protein